MRWHFKPGRRKDELIFERTKSRVQTDDQGVTTRTTCLGHCYLGSVFSGVLWSIWERTFEKDGERVRPPHRWIGCDLMQYRHEVGWGYKFLDDETHPDYYSCPLSYLDAVPIEVYRGHEAWREGVRRFHARGKAKASQ